MKTAEPDSTYVNHLSYDGPPVYLRPDEMPGHLQIEVLDGATLFLTEVWGWNQGAGNLKEMKDHLEEIGLVTSDRYGNLSSDDLGFYLLNIRPEGMA